MSASVSCALVRASWATNWTFSQISTASCSTQPGLGKIWWCSFWPTETIRPRTSNSRQRDDAVPWSIAAI